MNEQKFRQLTAITSFCFALFCLLWVVFTYLLLPFTEGQKNYTLMINDPEWIFVTSSGLVASILGIFTVFGIYHANHNKGGILLFIGIVLLVLGLLLEMASLTWDTFIWPVICTNNRYSSFVSDGIFIQSIQFIIYIIALLSLLFFGSILTAFGLLKTKTYGKIIPLLLISGIILYVTGNFLLIHIASFGLGIYSLAFILIGLRLWKA